MLPRHTKNINTLKLLGRDAPVWLSIRLHKRLRHKRRTSLHAASKCVLLGRLLGSIPPTRCGILRWRWGCGGGGVVPILLLLLLLRRLLLLLCGEWVERICKHHDSRSGDVKTPILPPLFNHTCGHNPPPNTPPPKLEEGPPYPPVPPPNPPSPLRPPSSGYRSAGRAPSTSDERSAGAPGDAVWDGGSLRLRCFAMDTTSSARLVPNAYGEGDGSSSDGVAVCTCNADGGGDREGDVGAWGGVRG